VGCVALGYPDAPYGTEPGSVVQNFCLRGLRQPHPGSDSADSLEEIRLSDYYPGSTSTVSTRLILLNSAAVWCSACRIEHETLSQRASEYAPQGLLVFTALFQAQDGSAATVDDLLRWTRVFDTNFPIALDPTYKLGKYAAADTAPLNLLIDASDMTIVQKYIGDQSDVMWPLIAERLAKP
jgi:hypothetical protein